MKQIRNIIGGLATFSGLLLMGSEDTTGQASITECLLVYLIGIVLFVGGMYLLKAFIFQQSNKTKQK